MADSGKIILPGMVAATVLLAWRRRRRIDFRGASVVITGGSRGLGLELARLFAAEGARLTLLARDRDELAAARLEIKALEADVLVRACDVGNRQAAEAAIDFVLEKRGRLDVLINNAGIIQVGPLAHLELEDFEQAMAVHAWGALYLIRAATPAMRRQGSGRIVNIASIGGLIAVPHLLPYSMSKFALVGLSDGLRAELAQSGIRVTTVAPGLMRTGSHVNARFKGQHEKEFAWFAVSAALPLFSTSARRAARQILAACRLGRPRLIITPQARLLHFVNALFPGLAAAGQNLAVRLLPGAAASGGHQLKSGWESRSPALPAFLTRLADRAIGKNLEGKVAAPPQSP